MFRHSRVGIIVPTLGTRPSWLAQAVASVERQGGNIRLAIACPPDIAETIAEQFPGRTIVREAEKGVAAAIEAGWRALSDCDLVAWLGDDDELTPGSVHAAVEALAQCGQAVMVYGDYECVDARGRPLVAVRPGRLASRWLQLGQNFIAQPGCIYVREAIVQSGGLAKNLGLAFDVELHRRLVRQSAAYCPATLARVRVHPSRLTTARNEESLAQFDEAVWGARPRPVGRRILYRLGPFLRLSGRAYYRFRRTYPGSVLMPAAHARYP
jgi:hypothetical protein